MKVLLTWSERLSGFRVACRNRPAYEWQTQLEKAASGMWKSRSDLGISRAQKWCSVSWCKKKNPLTVETANIQYWHKHVQGEASASHMNHHAELEKQTHWPSWQRGPTRSEHLWGTLSGREHVPVAEGRRYRWLKYTGFSEDEGRELGHLCEEMILLTGPVLFHPDGYGSRTQK